MVFTHILMDRNMRENMKTINDYYNNTEKVMLVDGDLLAYKLTSSLEEVIDWGSDNSTLWSDFKIESGYG